MGAEQGKKHIISDAIEHHAVLHTLKKPASVWNSTPFSRQRAPISRMGWMVPISLLTYMMVTRQVSDCGVEPDSQFPVQRGTVPQGPRRGQVLL